MSSRKWRGQGIRQKALLCISTQKKKHPCAHFIEHPERIYISVLSGHLKQRVITGVKEMMLYNLKGLRVITVGRD